MNNFDTQLSLKTAWENDVRRNCKNRAMGLIESREMEIWGGLGQNTGAYD